MAIDLPPVIPPQQSSTERIAQYVPAGTSVIEASVQGTKLEISGNRYLPEAEIRELIAAAANPSDAIRALNAAYYRAGHLLVTLYYAPAADKILVHVVNGKLSKINAPAEIEDYFAGLEGDDDLTIAEFDRRRVLADLRAKRAGVDYKITYKLRGDPEAYTMVFTPQAAVGYDETDIDIQIGNQGNRFVGRYFGSAGWTERFSNGVELKLNVDAAIPDLGEARGGREYNGAQFKLSYPSSGGLYGIEASNVTYERALLLDEPIEVSSSDITGLGVTDLDQLQDVLDNSGAAGDLLGGLIGSALQNDNITNLTELVDLLNTEGPLVISAVDLDSRTNAVSLTGEQVVLSSNRHRLTVVERLERVDSVINAVGFGTLMDEEYTSLELGLKYSRKGSLFGKKTRYSVQSFVKRGMSTDAGTFGTDDRENAVAIGKRSAEYLVVRPKLSMRIDLADWLNTQFDLIGQWSDGEQVPQKQQFVLGGLSTLSAWLPGVLIGDTGVFSRLKFESRKFEWLGGKHTLSLFVEYGQAEYENAGGAAAETRELSDGGLRYTGEWPSDIEMSIVAASELGSDNMDDELLDAVSADFFWRLKKTF